MTFDRSEILSAWLIVGLALAAVGLVPPMARRDTDPPAAIDVSTLRPGAGAMPVAGALPLDYDADDFVEWLARRRGTELAAGVIDADS